MAIVEFFDRVSSYRKREREKGRCKEEKGRDKERPRGKKIEREGVSMKERKRGTKMEEMKEQKRRKTDKDGEKEHYKKRMVYLYQKNSISRAGNIINVTMPNQMT